MKLTSINIQVPSEYGYELLPPPGPGKVYVKRAGEVIWVYKYDGDTFDTTPGNLQLRIYYPEVGPGPGNLDELVRVPLNSQGAFPVESLQTNTATENTAIITDWGGSSQAEALSAAGFINQPWAIGTNDAFEKTSPATNGTIHIRFYYSIIDISDIW